MQRRAVEGARCVPVPAGAARKVVALVVYFFFFLKDPAPPEFSPFPLPAPLPICRPLRSGRAPAARAGRFRRARRSARPDGTDRKSTRLNSSHLGISYAVFCL